MLNEISQAQNDIYCMFWASLVASDGKESTCNAGDSVLFLGWKDPLEKGMATHSNILA